MGSTGGDRGLHLRLRPRTARLDRAPQRTLHHGSAMSFSPLDSELFGPLFATDAMRACFSDTAWIGSMLAVEAALARSESQFGLASIALAPAIEAIRPEDLDIAA